MVADSLLAIDNASMTALRTAIYRFGKLDTELALSTEAEVAILAHEVAAAMRREFKPHDRGPLQDGDGRHIRTIDTLRVDLMGQSALISMRGGAVFVEYGSRPHVIEASPGKSLAWQEAGGGWHFAKRVNHPGYRGDDFVGRAIADVALVGALSRILEHTGLRQFVVGKHGLGSVMDRSTV